MIQTLTALGAFLLVFCVMVAVTDIDRCVLASIKEAGLRNTVLMMVGAVGFIVIFISAMWILYGLGFE